MINKIISVFFPKKIKSQYKFAFTIFEFLTKIYSRLMGFLEDIFFKNKKHKESFNNSGIFKFELAFNANSFIKNAKKVRCMRGYSGVCVRRTLKAIYTSFRQEEKSKNDLPPLKTHQKTIKTKERFFKREKLKH